jgi:Tfp pilus assembly protein PilN
MMRRIDLLPSTYAEKRRERRNIGLVLLAGLAVLALLVFYWVILGARVDNKKDELTEVQQQNRELQAQITQLQRFEALAAEVQEKRDALVAVTGLDIDWSALLTEIALVTPSDVWLTDMAGSRAGSEGETPVDTEAATVRISKTAPSGRIAFTGRALDMVDVATWLDRLKDVRGVTAVYLGNAVREEIEGQEVVTFETTVELTERALSNRFTGEEVAP